MCLLIDVMLYHVLGGEVHQALQNRLLQLIHPDSAFWMMDDKLSFLEVIPDLS